MLLGDREPAPPDLEERHQQLCCEGAGLTFIQKTTFLEKPDRRLAGLRALHELVAQEDVTEFLSEDPAAFLLGGEPVVAVENDRTLAGNVTDGPADPRR